MKAEVPHGVTVRVSGSVAQLGYFSPGSSIPLHTSPTELSSLFPPNPVGIHFGSPIPSIYRRIPRFHISEFLSNVFTV